MNINAFAKIYSDVQIIAVLALWVCQLEMFSAQNSK